jgi:hypothetical protein
MELIVKIKTVYGVDKIYPVNEAAKFIAEIAGTVTLTAAAIKAAKKAGYTIVVETPAIAL